MSGFVSGYKAVWIMVLFDLPVLTKKQRKAATRFRKDLMEDGFWMLQFSVYARPCPSDENAAVHLARVEAALPADGQVRIVMVTDKQYGRMRVFFGKKGKKPEVIPGQLELF